MSLCDSNKFKVGQYSLLSRVNFDAPMIEDRHIFRFFYLVYLFHFKNLTHLKISCIWVSEPSILK